MSAMTRAEIASQALQLSESERLALAEELWASVEHPDAHREDLPLPQWQADVLEQRLVESRDDPGKSWAEVKAEIWPAGS